MENYEHFENNNYKFIKLYYVKVPYIPQYNIFETKKGISSNSFGLYDGYKISDYKLRKLEYQN